MKKIISILLFISSVSGAFGQYDTDTIHHDNVYIPNSFTADGDNYFDGWRVYSDTTLDDFLVEIYDRWGNLVWYSTNQRQWWIGENIMDSGNYYSPIGTYTYLVSYKKNGNPYKKYGIINKIR